MNVPGGSSSNDLQFSRWNGSSWTEFGEINYNSGSLDFTSGFYAGGSSGISFGRRQPNVIESESTNLWLNYNNSNHIFLAAGSGGTGRVRVGDYSSGGVSKKFEVIGDAFIDTHLYVDNTVNIGVGHDSSLDNALSLGSGVAMETAVKNYGSVTSFTVDFDAEPLQKMTTAGTVAPSSSTNRAAGRSVVILIDNSAGAQRSYTLNSSWKFIGEKPSAIASGKVAILSLTCFGTAETDVICSYGVED